MERSKELSEFGEFLRSKRQAAGLTQLALGVELGFESGQFISTLERGIRPLPARHIPKIAKALNLDESSLIEKFSQVLFEQKFRELAK